MPSERFPELGYALWNMFRFDNALSNLAHDTLRVMTEVVVGCAAQAGPLHRPNERPHIERFFGTLASALAHRLPSTNGTGVSDPRRRIKELGAGAPAIVRLDELMELTAVTIANYDAHPHAGLGGRSPTGNAELLHRRETHRLKVAGRAHAAPSVPAVLTPTRN